jgi:hypothetical protein
LALVSAPAGYGKSILISCWLETCGSPSAWLSLDEHDNDLHWFREFGFRCSVGGGSGVGCLAYALLSYGVPSRCQEKLAWGMEHRVNAKSFTLCIMLFDFPSLQSHIPHLTTRNLQSKIPKCAVCVKSCHNSRSCH